MFRFLFLFLFLFLFCQISVVAKSDNSNHYTKVVAKIVNGRVSNKPLMLVARVKPEKSIHTYNSLGIVVNGYARHTFEKTEGLVFVGYIGDYSDVSVLTFEVNKPVSGNTYVVKRYHNIVPSEHCNLIRINERITRVECNLSFFD